MGEDRWFAFWSWVKVILLALTLIGAIVLGILPSLDWDKVTSIF